MRLHPCLAAVLTLGAPACDDAIRPATQSVEVSIQPDSLPLLGVGFAIQLSAVVTGSSNSEVEWASSNGSIATVDQTGLVIARAIGTASIVAVSRADRNARDSVWAQIQTVDVEVPGPAVIIDKVLDHATHNEIANGVLKDTIDVQVSWDGPPILGTGQLLVQMRGQFLCSRKFRDTPRGTYTCVIDTRPFPNDTARLTALLADTTGRYLAASTSRLFTIAN